MAPRDFMRIRLPIIRNHPETLLLGPPRDHGAACEQVSERAAHNPLIALHRRSDAVSACFRCRESAPKRCTHRCEPRHGAWGGGPDSELSESLLSVISPLPAAGLIIDRAHSRAGRNPTGRAPMRWRLHRRRPADSALRNPHWTITACWTCSLPAWPFPVIAALDLGHRELIDRYPATLSSQQHNRAGRCPSGAVRHIPVMREQLLDDHHLGLELDQQTRGDPRAAARADTRGRPWTSTAAPPLRPGEARPGHHQGRRSHSR